MPDQRTLEARLASLHRAPPSAAGSNHPGGAGGLKERLEALSGVVDTSEGLEEQFNGRLEALIEDREGGGGVPTADDLAARFKRLGGGDGDDGAVGAASTDASAAAAPGHQQQYRVPEDCSDDWADLDDLLEAALDGESLVSTNKTSSAAAQVAGGFPGSPEDEALVGNKLSELDALLKSEAAAADCSERASAAGRFEQAGVEASKVMEAFLRGGGQGEEGEESDTPTRRDHLGHEEERLLEMMTEQVRLEGHGLIAPASTPAQGESGELWLPLAPTAPPVARPGHSNAQNVAASSDSNNSASRGEAARLLAQQAMDEARLGLGGEGDAQNRGRGRAGGVAGAAGPGAKFGGGGKGGGEGEPREEAVSWCCVCSEDATLRCRECEQENGDGAGAVGHAEPELFCARCFKEIHREDPDMKAHRPQGLKGAGGGRSENGGARKGWRGWR